MTTCTSFLPHLTQNTTSPPPPIHLLDHPQSIYQYNTTQPNERILTPTNPKTTRLYPISLNLLLTQALITSGDNCSCVVICLNQKKRPRRKSSLKTNRRKSALEAGGTGGTSNQGKGMESLHAGRTCSPNAGNVGSFDAAAGAVQATDKEDENVGEVGLGGVNSGRVV